MRTELGVAIIVLAGVVSFGGVYALTRTPTSPTAASPVSFEVEKPVYTIVPAMDLPLKKQVVDAPVKVGPPPAFSTQTPIATLIANPDTRAVMFQDLPALASVSGAQIEMVGTMSLRTVQSMLPAILTNDA
ncbi:MAG: hypothetical protein JWM33_1772, partial [Caulobacteraceae bacterium]|nr:hypothetical protein [Caulobacteraceae bacterium]